MKPKKKDKISGILNYLLRKSTLWIPLKQTISKNRTQVITNHKFNV